MEPKKESAFKRWYAKNAQKLAEQRKKKYWSDPEYRAKCLSSNKVYRDTKAKPRRQPYPPVKPTKLGMPMEVYRIGQVAKMIGRTGQSIRKWEKDGLIPKPIVEAGQRYYTPRQVELMRELAAVLDRYHHSSRAEINAAIAAKRQEVFNNWNEVR